MPDDSKKDLIIVFLMSLALLAMVVLLFAPGPSPADRLPRSIVRDLRAFIASVEMYPMPRELARF